MKKEEFFGKNVLRRIEREKKTKKEKDDEDPNPAWMRYSEKDKPGNMREKLVNKAKKFAFRSDEEMAHRRKLEEITLETKREAQIAYAKAKAREDIRQEYMERKPRGKGGGLADVLARYGKNFQNQGAPGLGSGGYKKTKQEDYGMQMFGSHGTKHVTDVILGGKRGKKKKQKFDFFV